MMSWKTLSCNECNPYTMVPTMNKDVQMDVTASKNVTVVIKIVTTRCCFYKLTTKLIAIIAVKGKIDCS